MATFATPAPSSVNVVHPQDTQALLAAIAKAYSLGWWKQLPTIERFDETNVHPWTFKHGMTVLELAGLNVMPSSEIYITDKNPRGGSFNRAVAPAVCKATGFLAAQRIAEGSHRLATKEEAERCEQESREREKICAEMEYNSPEARKARQNSVMSPEFLEALRGNNNNESRDRTEAPQPQTPNATGTASAGGRAPKASADNKGGNN